MCFCCFNRSKQNSQLSSVSNYISMTGNVIKSFSTFKLLDVSQFSHLLGEETEAKHK